MLNGNLYNAICNARSHDVDPMAYFFYKSIIIVYCNLRRYGSNYSNLLIGEQIKHI